MNTDADLVGQARQGKVSSYEALVRRWSAPVTAYLRAKVCHAEVAEDLAQESFLRAYHSLATLSNSEKFGSWLLSIAHRLALDWLKAKARTEVRFTDVQREDWRGSSGDDWAANVDPPDEACSQAEDHEILLAMVDELPESLREVLLIYYYDDVTYKDIALMLDVSTATVNARLSKARQMLRDRMSATRSDQ